MQYVRSISGSVSKTWNSINPATLSGAIDVIVVEQQDGIYIEAVQPAARSANFAYRLSCLLTISRSIWKVFTITAVREKGLALQLSFSVCIHSCNIQVEFTVNGVKQPYAMKLGEGGEAFFVFETLEDIPEDLQTSPLVSPATSPISRPSEPGAPSGLQEPDFFDLASEQKGKVLPSESESGRRPSILAAAAKAQSDIGESH
jgi:phosphatidate phosphatase LPIN